MSLFGKKKPTVVEDAVPATVEQAIPITEVYDDGICLVGRNLWSKTFKALPRNPRMAHLLASFPSYFTKILAGSAAAACEFLYCLTKNPTAKLHHRNYAVMP